MDKVPDRGSPSRSMSERRASFFPDGRFVCTGHAAARKAAVRHLDFVYSLWSKWDLHTFIPSLAIRLNKQ